VEKCVTPHEDAGGTVMTVLGAVPPQEIGVTLMHEHLLVDLTCNWSPPAGPSPEAPAFDKVRPELGGILRRNPLLSRDNCLLDDLELAIAEAGRFKALGGGTIVDVTLPDIGRDPRALQTASRATGIHIIAGCGHYTYPAHPATISDESTGAVADRLVQEITGGIGDTGVRPGVIGELGTSDPLHPDEVKVLRAAALAARRTGTAVTLHVISWLGHEVLDILESEGMDLARVVVGHQDLLITLPPCRREAEVVDYIVSLARRGCTIELDCFGKEHWFPPLAGSSQAFRCPSDGQRLQLVADLLDAGLLDQVVLSHDVCHKIELLAFGGFGYGHLLRSVYGALQDAGLTEAELQTMFHDNPRRLLTIQPPVNDGTPEGFEVAAIEEET
jgi:phosphotriesterase-related protein